MRKFKPPILHGLAAHSQHFPSAATPNIQAFKRLP